MSKTKSASINVRLYPELKKEAENIFAYHGLSLPDAITVFLNYACRVGGFPFELKGARWQDTVSMAALEECKQLENDPNAKGFRNMAELIADLDSDDVDE